MHVLRVEHSVPDYDRWKQAFDDDPIGRERAGVRRYRILRKSRGRPANVTAGERAELRRIVWKAVGPER